MPATVPTTTSVPQPAKRKGNGADSIGPDAQKRKPLSGPHEDLLPHGFWIHDATVTTARLYVLKGLFGKGHLIVMWGPPGAGKSFVVLEMVCFIGAGLTWRGLRTQRGIVLYIVAESSRPFVENRIAALKKANPALAEADVLVIPLALDLLHAPQGDVDRVIQTAKVLAQRKAGVCLIVVDTLATTFGGGQENESGDMGMYTANIKRIITETGAAVLLVHHCGKNESAGMRGHSGLLAALDAEIAIEGKPGGTLMLRAGKVRDGSLAFKDIFAFNLRTVELGTDADGDPVESCVIETFDEAGTKRVRRQRKSAGLGKNQKAALRILDAAGGRMARSDLALKLKAEGVDRPRIYEAIAALLTSGMVAASNDAAEVFIP